MSDIWSRQLQSQRSKTGNQSESPVALRKPNSRSSSLRTLSTSIALHLPAAVRRQAVPEQGHAAAPLAGGCQCGAAALDPCPVPAGGALAAHPEGTDDLGLG
jgi:hypothetical protein